MRCYRNFSRLIMKGVYRLVGVYAEAEELIWNVLKSRGWPRYILKYNIKIKFSANSTEPLKRITIYAADFWQFLFKDVIKGVPMLQKTWRHRTEFNGFAAYLVFTLISTRLTALHNLSKEQREIVFEPVLSHREPALLFISQNVAALVFLTCIFAAQFTDILPKNHFINMLTVPQGDSPTIDLPSWALVMHTREYHITQFSYRNCWTIKSILLPRELNKFQ
jgi:hypothetical protein